MKHSNEEPDHFDDLIKDDVQTFQASGSHDSTRLTEDDFHKVFCLCFTVSHNVTGLNSLAVDESDGSAKNCSKAIYDTICDIPALHFILNPSGVWGQRAMMIGAFALPMAMNVRKEIAERKGAVSSIPAQKQADVAPSSILEKFA